MTEEKLLESYIQELKSKFKNTKKQIKDMENTCYNYKKYIEDINSIIDIIGNDGNISEKQLMFINARINVYTEYIYIINEKEDLDLTNYLILAQIDENDINILNIEDFKFTLNKLKNVFMEKLLIGSNLENIKNVITKINKVVRLYDENRLYDDLESVNFLMSFIDTNKESNVLNKDDEKILIEYIMDKYTEEQQKKEQEIKRLEMIKKEREEKERLEKIEQLQKLIEQEDIIEKQNNEKNKYFSIFTSEEQEFITLISDIVYDKNVNIKYINEYHESIIKYEYSELLELEIDITEEKYNKYKKDILLKNMYTIIKELKIIKEESKKYSENSLEYNILFESKQDYLNNLNNLYITYESSELIEENNNKSNKNLIYLKNNMNELLSLQNTKTYKIIKDSAPEEYYLSYLNLIEKLESGYVPKSNVKGGKYTTNSKKALLYRLKNFKTRIVYMPLVDNNVLVLTSLYKKSTNDTYDSKLIDLVYLQNKEYIEKLKADLKDDTKKEQILKENVVVTNELKQFLITNSRGKKLIK